MIYRLQIITITLMSDPEKSVEPDYPLKFEERRFLIMIYDLAVADAIYKEAGAREASGAQIVDSCLKLVGYIERTGDNQHISLRNLMGTETKLSIMDEKYQPWVSSAPKFLSPVHAFKLNSAQGNDMMDLCNKYGIEMEEAFERSLRLGTDVSREQRESHSTILLHEQAEKPRALSFFPIPTI